MRDFEDRDYEELARLRGLPGGREAEWRRDHPGGQFFRLRRGTAEQDGKIVGFAQFEQNHRTPAACYLIDVVSDQPDQYSLLFDQIVSTISKEGMEELRVHVPAGSSAKLSFFVKRGFYISNTLSCLQLDLERVVFEDMECAIRSIRDRGYSFRGLNEILGDEKECLRLWQVYQEASADIPMGSPPREETFEQFRSRVLDRASLLRGLSCAAVYQNEYVAVVELHDSTQPDTLNVRYTGVARVHRSRGIATALKLECIRRAREAGVRRLIAWNHTNNPSMMRVNEKLGFEPIEQVHDLRASIRPGAPKEGVAEEPAESRCAEERS